MERIDPNTLATHLEVALTCAPDDTLSLLADTDSLKRRKATLKLAEWLADRLGCFEVTAGETLVFDQPVLFKDAPLAKR